MNGNIYEEIKKNGNSKRREKLKFMTIILSTNVLAVVFGYAIAPNELPFPTQKTIQKIIHPHFKMIVVPLTVLIDINQTGEETPITLMSKSKKILIPRAYLHEMILAKNQDLESTTRYKIEIPEDQILQLTTNSEDPMFAIPELVNHENKPTLKRVSHYEIYL